MCHEVAVHKSKPSPRASHSACASPSLAAMAHGARACKQHTQATLLERGSRAVEAPLACSPSRACHLDLSNPLVHEAEAPQAAATAAYVAFAASRASDARVLAAVAAAVSAKLPWAALQVSSTKLKSFRRGQWQMRPRHASLLLQGVLSCNVKGQATQRVKDAGPPSFVCHQ